MQPTSGRRGRCPLIQTTIGLQYLTGQGVEVFEHVLGLEGVDPQRDPVRSSPLKFCQFLTLAPLAGTAEYGDVHRVHITSDRLAGSFQFFHTVMKGRHIGDQRDPAVAPFGDATIDVG